MSGMMTGVLFDGAKIANKTHVTSVSSFSLERSELSKTNLDTRAVVNTLPSNFSSEGIGDGNFHDWIPRW